MTTTAKPDDDGRTLHRWTGKFLVVSAACVYRNDAMTTTAKPDDDGRTLHRCREGHGGLTAPVPEAFPEFSCIRVLFLAACGGCFDNAAYALMGSPAPVQGGFVVRCREASPHRCREGHAALSRWKGTLAARQHDSRQPSSGSQRSHHAPPLT